MTLPPFRQGVTILQSVPEAAFGPVLHQVQHANPLVVFVARDDKRVEQLAEQLAFFAPDVPLIDFPAWDCLPYDRMSPNAGVVSRRTRALCMLAQQTPKQAIILTTVNALLQRVPPAMIMQAASFRLATGTKLNRDALTAFLADNGYSRTGKVMEPGEFAVRGSIIDLFPAGEEEAIRIDCFDDEIESLTRFDPLTQASVGQTEPEVLLLPASEALLHQEAITRFRMGWRERFGAGLTHPLYNALSEGRKHPGYEHWLPLFYERMDTLLSYLPSTVSLVFDHLLENARIDRQELIRDYYEARQEFDRAHSMDKSPPYHPLPPEALYLDEEEWQRLKDTHCCFALENFQQDVPDAVDMPYAPALNFSSARTQGQAGLLAQVTEHIRAVQQQGKRVALAATSDGSRERLRHMFTEQGLHLVQLTDWNSRRQISGKSVGLMTLPLEQGVQLENHVIISEQDIFGERIMRAARKKKASDRFLEEAASFLPGELVVHKEHGIGRFAGLETITAGGAPHDCLKLLYRDDDRLFVPVENSDILSRYGSEEDGAQLDKLGAAGWQTRKAKLKERIKLAAEALLKIAAERALAKGDVITPPEGMFDEFCARFPYAETEDQLSAIGDVLTDLASGRPMDRLICGDVGFGKTEVALRAAFAAAYPDESGERGQVAIICPTTLLARQHYKTFTERFAGLPFRVRSLSRLIAPKDAKSTKEGLASGEVDIVVGTHALLAKNVSFKNLKLLIVDEEQNFGVAQKERLKEFRAQVHILTLSATPIPRTLQLSLAGIKELSLITTPPVDRLAVRTFVGPYDPVVTREAILREHFRGGKIFYVCPRIKDIDALATSLKQLVPEIKIGIAHGQMPPNDLDRLMNEFYDGTFQMLISTNIVESGLDIPSANTLFVHKAHLFGLAQLYQLRGRVGRGKTRAYAYFTLPYGVNITPTAVKRLEVMQTLDTLGAGFTLASHDMDIRGFGNILGDEQTGHIREVGVELYQQMLEDAVQQAKARQDSSLAEEVDSSGWTPQINLGMAVLIPEAYVSDLGLRMGLYRRAATFKTPEELDAFAVELVDRFGPMPDELNNLLEVVRIKQLCRIAGIEKLDAGPKGVVMSFHNNSFNNPGALVDFISRRAATVKLRADHKLVMMQEWATPQARLKGVTQSLNEIVSLAA